MKRESASVETASMNDFNLKRFLPYETATSLKFLTNGGMWLMLFFALVVLPINQAVPSEQQLVIFVMLYFALAWAAYFYVFLARRRASVWIGLATAVFAVVVGIPFGRALKYTIFAPFYHINSSPYDIVRLVGDVGSHGMAEESLKFLPVILLAFVFKRVKSPIDGMFYGAMAGLGFAAWEGYKYVIDPQYGGVLIQTLIRSTALPFLHAAYTAIGSYFVALAMREKTAARRIKICAMGYLVAATVHGVYDFLAGNEKIAMAIFIFLLFSAYATQSHEVAEEFEQARGEKSQSQLQEAQAAAVAG